MKSRLQSLTLITLVFSILFLSIAACSTGPEEASTLVYGLTLAISGIDPHLNASSELGIPLRSVYDTLVFLDPETSKFVPGLAERWTISPDGLTYIFTLRRDVTFHDGTPFNAQTVLANLNRIRNPDNHSQKAVFMLGPLEEVEIIDSDLGFELCQRDGVEAIVIGTFAKAGDMFVTDAKVLDVNTKTLLDSVSSRGRGVDSILANQIDELSQGIAKGLGLSERRVAESQTVIADVTTSSLEAYDAYLKGLEHYRRFSPDDLGKAVFYFKKAIELDPDYSRGHAAMALAYRRANDMLWDWSLSAS